MSDRIPCINPRCRRTAPASRYAPGTEIICGKCFRALPPAIRNRHRQLERRERHVSRRIERRTMAGTIAPSCADTIKAQLARQLDDSWQRIRQSVVAPEHPVGLAGFLHEMGLA